MNRRERRSLERKFGITEAKKKMPLQERLKMLRENIERGKMIHQENEEASKRRSSEKSDKQAAQRISYIATDLMINHGMSFVDAQEKAKELYAEELQKSES